MTAFILKMGFLILSRKLHTEWLGNEFKATQQVGELGRTRPQGVWIQNLPSQYHGTFVDGSETYHQVL